MKVNQAGGHLDQMLRQTRQHHVQLSTLADLKANMLLTLSCVIITISVPQLVSPGFRAPLLVLIVSCLVTIALATYTVMPKLPLSHRGLPVPNVEDPGFNVLFFGDYTRLPYPKYEEAMEKILNDPSRTYEAQIRELYTLGVFLAEKKYRYLKLAYLSFLAGLLATTLTALLGG